jgi:predicted transcriptional regulator YdeE
MPKLSIQKSIQINAAPELVFARVRDFKQWPQWSPWLSSEPDCALTYSSDGSSYSWDGKVIGSGKMTRVSEQDHQELRYELQLFKPWKSTSAVTFQFSPKDGGTKVNWAMDGSLPFFLFFLKPLMTGLIGMDYERGLKMLKDYVEIGTVPATIEYPGHETVSGFAYIGIRTRCRIDDIETAMLSDFEKLMGWYEGQDEESTGKPFTIYHRWELGKGFTDYSVGIPMKEFAVKTAPLPEGFTGGEVPACKAFVIRFTGPYRHLGNAWSAGMMRIQGKLIKQNKKIAPFEIYENDMRETPENALITKLCFPVK